MVFFRAVDVFNLRAGYVIARSLSPIVQCLRSPEKAKPPRFPCFPPTVVAPQTTILRSRSSKARRPYSFLVFTGGQVHWFEGFLQPLQTLSLISRPHF